MTEMPQTRVCTACGGEKKLIEFAARRKRCIACDTAEREAKRAKVQARREKIEYGPAIAQRIADAVAMGSTLAEIATQAWAPTNSQMMGWRRAHPEFAGMLEEARASRADARSDKIDEALNNLRAGTITAADCRVIVETELKMAGKEAPARYGDVTKIQQEVSGPNGAPLAVQVVDDASLIKTARWIADLLSRADAVPVLDLKPEASP